jgi:hypothetical protein
VVSGVHWEAMKGHGLMSMLDLLGTLAGAAFLFGSVSLAVRVDRREAAGRRPGPEAPPPPLALREPRRLRLVHDADR